jgi:hypothetical protein
MFAEGILQSFTLNSERHFLQAKLYEINNQNLILNYQFYFKRSNQ